MSLLHRFYSAFQRHDHAAMATCYHPDAHFRDPVFPNLDAKWVCAMWRMLLTSGTDLRLEFKVLEETVEGGKVHWDAYYTFSRTGRKVHNSIDARFIFKDGLIILHEDRFDLWKWSGQALGFPGWLLGWTPVIRNRVRSMAAASLHRSMTTKA
ncbi:MAG: nuclear transport factor 2 family protein [Flavobacteriales bacterium]|nr:nuclear transport factor 2 family protein [Flavobacteriales bacterium]